MAKISTLQTPSAPAPGGAMKQFLVNWTFSGFRENELKSGEVVEATEDEAAPFLGGVLSPFVPETSDEA